MKFNYLKIVILMFILAACGDDGIDQPSINTENLSGDAPVLTSPSSKDPVVFTSETAADTFEIYSWNRALFGGIGVRTTYELEMSGDMDFADSVLVLSTTVDTSFVALNGEINEAMIKLEISPDAATAFFLRVTAKPDNVAFEGSSALESQTLVRTATAFDVDAGPEPVGPSQFLVGSATDAGWSWDNPVELFQFEEGVFTGNTTLFPRTSDQAFRVFSENGNWDSGTNFPTFIENGYTVDTYFSNAGDGDSNFAFQGPEAVYTFVLNENDLTISLEIPQNDEPAKFIVGDGTQADWNWDNPVVLVQVESGVFRGILQLNSAGAFRVFAEEGNWDSGTNFPTYEGDGFTIDSGFENAGDGDSNFKFNGTDGAYIFTLDENSQTINLN